MPTIEIDSAELQKAEELVTKLLGPFFNELSDEGKFVFAITLMRQFGDEMNRVKEKFK